MGNLMVCIAVALSASLLFHWFIGGFLTVSGKRFLWGSIPGVAAVYYLLLLLYKPVFYYENYLLFMAVLCAVCRLLTGLGWGHCLLIGWLFGIDCRITTQLALYPVALVRPGFITEVVEKDAGIHLASEAAVLLLRYLGIRLLKKHLNTLIPSGISRLFCVLAGIPFFSSVILQICVLPFIDASYKALRYRDFFLILILTFLSYLLLLLGVSFVSEQQKRSEAERAQLLAQRQYEYFQRERERDQSLRALQHDMRNHLSCISRMTDSREVTAYVQDIYRELKAADPCFHTGNAILDAVLDEKNRIALDKGLELQAIIDFTQGDFLRNPDICTIFGNLLDNAIEAAEKTDSPEKRSILLKCASGQGHLLIKCVNCFADPPEKKGARFLSRKEGPGHGLGLSSVELCVKKYGGRLYTDLVEDRFEASVLLPLEAATYGN